MCMQDSLKDTKPHTAKSITIGLVEIEDFNSKSSVEKLSKKSITSRKTTRIRQQEAVVVSRSTHVEFAEIIGKGII